MNIKNRFKMQMAIILRRIQKCKYVYLFKKKKIMSLPVEPKVILAFKIGKKFWYYSVTKFF